MEFNDLLTDEKFLESYNRTSRIKGRQMQAKVRNGGCFFELKELDEEEKHEIERKLQEQREREEKLEQEQEQMEKEKKELENKNKKLQKSEEKHQHIKNIVVSKFKLWIKISTSI